MILAALVQRFIYQYIYDDFVDVVFFSFLFVCQFWLNANKPEIFLHFYLKLTLEYEAGDVE